MPATPNASPSAPAAVPAADYTPLVTAAVDAAAALAADDHAGYLKVFPALVAAAGEFPALPQLEPGEDLRAARRSFEPWSTAVADLLKPHRDHLGLKIYQCPMSPVVGKGRWIQRAAPLRNPFFGSGMLSCGAEAP